MAMGNPLLLSSIPLKFTLILSFSLTCSSYYSPPTTPKWYHSISNRKKPPSTTATAGDILSLLGTPQQASTVDPQVASQLQSCFKFLVPFTTTTTSTTQSLTFLGIRFPRRFLNSKKRPCDSVSHENELVWSPPAPVLDIARLAFDSGGDTASIQRTLDPTIIYRSHVRTFLGKHLGLARERVRKRSPGMYRLGRVSVVDSGYSALGSDAVVEGYQVPDVEGCNENRCELTRTPYGRHFINEELNSYMEFLFELIVDRASQVGLNVSLNRYDFFHGHLFIAADGRVGILFHAKEYPAYNKQVFPYNMGYCQKGSNVTYDDSMNMRNILWLAPLPSNSTSGWSAPGVLVVLDAHPGGIIYRDIIPDYAKYARTIYEEYFGDIVVDVNYLNVGAKEPDYQIFIC